MARLRRALVLGLIALAGRAGADGAFPDSMAIFAPADRPLELVLAANFGLVATSDGGVTWHLACEQAVASFVNAYQMSAAPDDALFADAPYGLAVSRDGGCSWTFATGPIAGGDVKDSFPDPTAAGHVFAIASQTSGGGAPTFAVFESNDGGASFGAPIFASAAGTTISGVESARSSPTTIYLTLYDDAPFRARLARSIGGAPFQIVDATAALADPPLIAAVDPADARTLYLRLKGASHDSLAISRDGGDTFAVPLALGGRMSALLKRASGTLLVGAPDGPSYRSTDGGLTFAAWPGAPHVRALAERGGVLYVAADDLNDGFALAASTDEGAHWQPLLHFDDIVGPATCGNLPQVCGPPWSMLKSLFDAEPRDGGHPDASSPPPPRAGGCGCELGGAARGSLGLLALAVAIAAWSRRAARAARPR